MIGWIATKNSLVKLFCIYILGPIFKRQRTGANSNRILFIESAGLGDMCVLLPFVKRLTDNNYKTDVCCPEGVADLWRQFLSPDSRVITFNNKTLWSVQGVGKLCNDFGSNQYDAVFSVTQTSTAAFLSVCARSTLRIGMIQGNIFYKGSRILFDKTYRARPDEHMTVRIEKQFESFQSIPATINKFIAPSIPSETGKFLLIHPGAKWIPRRWPAENFKTLALMLRKQGIPVVIAAHTSEPDLLSFFADFNNGTDQQFIITHDLKSLLDLTAKCTVYIGNDTGPTHLANLFAKPMVVLWGGGHLERIAPLGENVTIIKKEVPCRPCSQKDGALRCSNGENICLTKMSVVEVFNTVLPIWEKSVV